MPDPVAALALLTAHMEPIGHGKQQRWDLYEQSCAVHWVLDGVVIESRVLDQPERCCSLALIASAEGLATDRSGFQLQETRPTGPGWERSSPWPLRSWAAWA